MNYGNQNIRQSGSGGFNTNRKPISRRVPITAPPTRATSVHLETETTSSAFVTTNKPITQNSFDRESVISAPVFYENHNKAKTKYNNNNPKNTEENKNVHILNVTNLQKTINFNQENSALRRCFETNARGLMWQETHYSAKPSQQCPNNPSSFAQWRCTEKNGKGVWANNWPDLSRCRSKWIEALLKNEDMRLIQHGRKIRAMTNIINENLQIEPIELYGGDLPLILDVIDSHLKSLKIGIQNQGKQDLSFNKYNLQLDLNSSINKLSSILSHLIDLRSIAAWKDLVGNKNGHKATVGKFMEVSENLGAVVSLMMTGSEKEFFGNTTKKQVIEDKGQHGRIKQEGRSSFLESGNANTYYTSRDKNTLATDISTHNICK